MSIFRLSILMSIGLMLCRNLQVLIYNFSGSSTFCFPCIYRFLHITVYGACVNRQSIVATKMYAVATETTIYGSLCKYTV